MKFLLIALVAVPLLIWAMSRDRSDWKSKSDDELRALAEGEVWGYWPTAIAELKKRGVDVRQFRTNFLKALGAESGKEQYAAYAVLKRHYPELNEELAKLRAIKDEDEARRYLDALIASSSDSD